MARRPRTWITDMGHYLEQGMLANMPTPAMDLALHLGAIVAWVSSHTALPMPETNVRCRTRTRAYGRCVGDVQARIAPDDAIEWFCILCHESGRISGWRQTLWDRSAVQRLEAEQSADVRAARRSLEEVREEGTISLGDLKKQLGL